MVSVLCEEGKPFHKHEDELEDAIRRFSFSKQFGWTPTQIKKLEEENEEDLLAYQALMIGLGKENNKKHGA